LIFAFDNVGNNMPVGIAMMAITPRRSIRANGTE